MKVDWLCEIIYREFSEFGIHSDYIVSEEMVKRKNWIKIKNEIIKELYHAIGSEIGEKYRDSIVNDITSIGDREQYKKRFGLEVFVFSISDLSKLIEKVINNYTPERLKL